MDRNTLSAAESTVEQVALLDVYSGSNRPDIKEIAFDALAASKFGRSELNKSATTENDRGKIIEAMIRAEKTGKTSLNLEIEALGEILLLAEKEAFVTGGTFSNGTARIAYEALQNSPAGRDLLSPDEIEGGRASNGIAAVKIVGKTPLESRPTL